MSANQQKSTNCLKFDKNLKYALFSEITQDSLKWMLEVVGKEEFTFVVNERRIESTLAEAALIWPAV
jgi:hypothetical protein